MKIAHLTSVHQPHDVRIFHKQCKSLRSNGYEVALVVKADSDQIIDSVQILAIPEESSRLKRFFYSSWAVYKKAIASKAKICHFHDPELIPTAILLSLRGRKVIYDVHEDLPRQILSKDWIPTWLRYPVSWLAATSEWIGSRLFFSAIVPATPKIASRFPESKTVLVQNFPLRDEFNSTATNKASYLRRPNRVIYVGGLSKIRGIVENINAFKYIQNSDCRLVLAGSFEDDKLESECRSLDGWSSIQFKGYLSRKEMQKIFDESRIGLVLFHPQPNHVDAQPNKMFEYMSASLPLIASDFPLWREIVEGAKCGLLVDPLKPEEIAKAIDWLLDHPEEAEQMGKNGRKAVEDKYNWSHEENKLLKLYKKLDCS